MIRYKRNAYDVLLINGEKRIVTNAERGLRGQPNDAIDIVSLRSFVEENRKIEVYGEIMTIKEYLDREVSILAGE